MSMSRQHYERVAEILNTSRHIYPSSLPTESAVTNTVVDGIAFKLAAMFREDNERFDLDRFMTAAGKQYYHNE